METIFKTWKIQNFRNPPLDPCKKQYLICSSDVYLEKLLRIGCLVEILTLINHHVSRYRQSTLQKYPSESSNEGDSVLAPKRTILYLSRILGLIINWVIKAGSIYQVGHWMENGLNSVTQVNYRDLYI